MEQLKIFAQGALRMLVMMALLIVCINTIVIGPGFIRVVGVISLVAVGYHIYKLFRNTRNN